MIRGLDSNTLILLCVLSRCPSRFHSWSTWRRHTGATGQGYTSSQLARQSGAEPDNGTPRERLNPPATGSQDASAPGQRNCESALPSVSV